MTKTFTIVSAFTAIVLALGAALIGSDGVRSDVSASAAPNRALVYQAAMNG